MHLLFSSNCFFSKSHAFFFVCLFVCLLAWEGCLVWFGLVGWLVNWLVRFVCLFFGFVCCLVGSLTGRLVYWFGLFGWLVGWFWLVGLVGWLVAWLVWFGLTGLFWLAGWTGLVWLFSMKHHILFTFLSRMQIEYVFILSMF
jgi:hypothetical protein